MNEQNIFWHAANRALRYRSDVSEKNPYPQSSAQELRALFDTGLPQKGRPGTEVLTQLADAAESGLVGSTGQSFYGWVMGASDPVGMAADWLTTAWGQNSAIYQTAPSAAIAEEVAGKYLIKLLELPVQSSVGFTTGATMASFICLAAARTDVLHRHGWNIEEQGQFGAPEVSVFVNEEAHSAIFATLRYLGFGANRLNIVRSDEQGRMDNADLIGKMKAQSGPSIIIAQAGHINTGACDDLTAIGELARSSGSWLHIDGAFGMWARASSDYSHLCRGAEKADSWAIDGHKWIQIPYDSGFAIVKNPDAHRRAMGTSAGYLNETAQDGRNPTHFVPELSRRARGFTVWAVLQSMGREGIANIVNKNSENAEQLAGALGQIPGVRVLNQVVLNQMALVFESLERETINKTQLVVDALQAQGCHFVKEATWRGQTIMRISFSSAPQESSKIEELAQDIADCWANVSGCEIL